MHCGIVSAKSTPDKPKNTPYTGCTEMHQRTLRNFVTPARVFRSAKPLRDARPVRLCNFVFLLFVKLKILLASHFSYYIISSRNLKKKVSNRFLSTSYIISNIFLRNFSYVFKTSKVVNYIMTNWTFYRAYLLMDLRERRETRKKGLLL